jgi:hypothetical protein
MASTYPRVFACEYCFVVDLSFVCIALSVNKPRTQNCNWSAIPVSRNPRRSFSPWRRRGFLNTRVVCVDLRTVHSTGFLTLFLPSILIPELTTSILLIRHVEIILYVFSRVKWIFCSTLEDLFGLMLCFSDRFYRGHGWFALLIRSEILQGAPVARLGP